MHHRETMRRPLGTDGISEVVGFVIILAVVMAGLSLYLTYAVPIQGREEEITVMDNVRAWFVDYKTGVDQLWLNSPLSDDPNDMYFRSTVGQVTLRKVIDPGTEREKGFVGRYLPLLAPLPCSGEISVRNGNYLEIGLTQGGEPVDISPISIPAPALVYTSHNYYWFQQEYSYQFGGIFLRQWDPEGEKVTLVAAPPISIFDEDGVRTKVELVAVHLDAAGSVGTASPIRVETRLATDPTVPDDLNGETMFSEVDLTFHGSSEAMALAWADVFTGAAARNGIDLPAPTTNPDGSITVIIRGPSNTAKDDVFLAVVDARYSMSLENVPTMIE